MVKSQVVFAPSAPRSSASESGKQLAQTVMLDPPTVLGRYALFGRIGAGGMGVVHLGRLLGSAGFERAVAIKRIHPLLASDQQFIGMFRDELRLLARVRHQNVISALDVVEVEGELLLVMEYVHGESLAALLQRSVGAARPIPIEIALSIACGVLKGLHAAHTATSAAGESLGIIHRDVSPHNVLVGCDGLARIVDFGVAKWSESRKVTQVGELRGKPGYVAPEQLVGEPASARSDIYSLSVVLWEMLAAQRLFAGKSLVETIERVSSAEVPAFAAVSARKIPPQLEAIVRRGLDRDPAARFATAREMASALEAAGRLVSPESLGEWVSATAGASLQERAHQLTWAENCAIGAPKLAPVVDDSEQTLVRSFEVPEARESRELPQARPVPEVADARRGREEPITRDFPLEALVPGATSPRVEPPSAPAAPRRGSTKPVLLGAALVCSLLVGLRVYRNVSANAEEAVRARAAAAVARAGLSSAQPMAPRRGATVEQPQPRAPAEPPPVVAAVAPPVNALSVAAVRAPAVSAVPLVVRKAPTAVVAKVKPVSVDGF